MSPVKNLLFELCLDNILLHQMTNNNNAIVSFSNETRRKIVSELYDTLEKRLKTFDTSLC